MLLPVDPLVLWSVCATDPLTWSKSDRVWNRYPLLCCSLRHAYHALTPSTIWLFCRLLTAKSAPDSFASTIESCWFFLRSPAILSNRIRVHVTEMLNRHCTRHVSVRLFWRQDLSVQTRINVFGLDVCTHTVDYADCAYLKYNNATTLITSSQELTIMIKLDTRYDICICNIII